MRSRFGDNTVLWNTTIGRLRRRNRSIYHYREGSIGKQLNRKVQIEGKNPQERSLERNDLCHTLSNAFEISRATIKDLPKFLRAEDQMEVTFRIKDHQLTWLCVSRSGDLIGGSYFLSVVIKSYLTSLRTLWIRSRLWRQVYKWMSLNNHRSQGWAEQLNVSRMKGKLKLKSHTPL